MKNKEAITRIQNLIQMFRFRDRFSLGIATALDMAIEALEKQDIPDTNFGDMISRQVAIEAMTNTLWHYPNECYRNLNEYEFAKGLAELGLKSVPSAQPELTDDRAIKHLQSTGWMQNHDKEMYEIGLRERLADDSGSYDGLIPCEDTISRQAAIDKLDPIFESFAIDKIKALPSAQQDLQPTCNQLATDCISRQAAIDAIANCTNCGDEKTLRAYVQKHNLDNGWTGGVLEAIDAIEDLPSAQFDIIRCNACKHWTQTTGNMPGFGLGDCDYLNAKLVSCNGFCYWAERRADG